jgi:glycosyltransferase A (GT-A) superfamily protein (DUF2064 family)
MRLVVVAKECIPGRVKTRLTPPLTPREAAALAQVSLDQTLATLRQVDVAERVLLLDGDPGGIDTSGFEVAAQVPGPLDERIAAAFDASISPLLLIGMDTPQVSRAVLQSVVDDEVSDAWFGPATDGGFWALGFREPRGDLVRGTRMSRSDTGAAQLDRLRGAGLRIQILPTLTDVDEADAAVVVAAMAPGTAFAAAVAGLGLDGRGAMAASGVPASATA